MSYFDKESVKNIYEYFKKVLPERFFDILYKNGELFLDESEHSTEFLPGIVFKQLWNLDISDKTKETIWKYLQTFSLITINLKSS